MPKVKVSEPGSTWKKGFLLSWIAGERGDVVCRHAQMSALVEANFADAALAFFDETAMAAGVTLQRAAFKMLGQFRRAFSGQRVEHIG